MFDGRCTILRREVRLDNLNKMDGQWRINDESITTSQRRTLYIMKQLEFLGHITGKECSEYVTLKHHIEGKGAKVIMG